MKLFVRLLMMGALCMLSALPVAAQDDVETNKALALRYFEEVYNANQPELLSEMVTEDFVTHFAWTDATQVALTGLIHDWHSPGLYETFRDVTLIAEGDFVAAFAYFDHDRGSFKAIYPVVGVMRFEGGRMAEMWEVGDAWYYRQSLASSEADVIGEGWYPQVGESTTSPDENHTLAASALDLWQTGAVERLPEVYADDLVFHLPPGISTEPLDRAGLAQYMTWLRAAMPDLTVKTEDMPVVAQGDLVVCAYAFTGKFAPEGAAFPRQINARAVDVYRVVDGKIAEVWWLWQPPDADGMPARLFAPPE